jgi:spore coat protein U-like protein
MKMAFAPVVAALLAASLAGPAWGQTCVVSSIGNPFGTYNPMAATAQTSASTVSVTCQSAVAAPVLYRIELSSGGSGNFGVRGMTGLRYQLYTDASRTQIWGDGTGGTVTVSDGYVLQPNVPTTRTYTVYSRLLASQRVAPGAYTDIIIARVIY